MTKKRIIITAASIILIIALAVAAMLITKSVKEKRERDELGSLSTWRSSPRSEGDR